MSATQSTSRAGQTSGQSLHVWCQGETHTNLLEQFHESIRTSLVQVSQPAEADFRLRDWRTGPDPTNLIIDDCAESQASNLHLPQLIVVNDHLDLNACLSGGVEVDLSNCEFINSCELNTTIAQARIARLMRSARMHAQEPVAKNHAQIILHEVMKYSNDWLVIKNLDHRFLYVSGKFCRTYGKSSDEIIGTDDLELGTPPELVFGKAESEWKGYWALDKEVTDSGIAISSPPLLLDEDVNMYESMDRVPLRDQNGNVFALLVCVYRFLQNPEPAAGSSGHVDAETKSTHLWDQKRSLPNNPA